MFHIDELSQRIFPSQHITRHDRCHRHDGMFRQSYHVVIVCHTLPIQRLIARIDGDLLGMLTCRCGLYQHRGDDKLRQFREFVACRGDDAMSHVGVLMFVGGEESGEDDVFGHQLVVGALQIRGKTSAIGTYA